MKPLVLICSTDYEFYLLLAQILNMGGLESSLVEGAEETLASVKSDELMAVIIDYHSDAFRIGDLVNQIRETLADKALPIAVFVGAGNQQLYLEVLKTGGCEIFMRPFNPERFLSYLLDLSPDGNARSSSERTSGNSLVYAEITMQLDSRRVECNVSAVSAPLNWLYFEACRVCEKVSRTIWRFAWQMMDLLGATKSSSRAAETGVGRMM